MKKYNLPFLAVSAGALLILAGYQIIDMASTDHTPPEIRFDTEYTTFSVHDEEDAYLQGVTAFDDRDGDVTEDIVIESVYGINDMGETTVTYAAFDVAGNVSKRTRRIFYSDYQRPRFSLDKPLIYEFGRTFDVLEFMHVEDVKDGDLSSSIKAVMTSNVASVTEKGMHDVLFSVTNSLGDTAQLTLPVEVCSVDAYTAELELDAYLIYLKEGASFRASDYLKALKIPGEDDVDLTGKLGTNFRLRTEGYVDTDVPGVYPVTYTVTYKTEDDSFSGFSRLFVVVEPNTRTKAGK